MQFSPHPAGAKRRSRLRRSRFQAILVSVVTITFEHVLDGQVSRLRRQVHTRRHGKKAAPPFRGRGSILTRA